MPNARHKRMEMELNNLLFPFTEEGEVKWDVDGGLRLGCVPMLCSYLNGVPLRGDWKNVEGCETLYKKIKGIANRYGKYPEMKNYFVLCFPDRGGKKCP